jgi:hypothetical protein
MRPPGLRSLAGTGVWDHVVLAEEAVGRSHDRPIALVNIELYQTFLAHLQQDGLASFVVDDVRAPFNLKGLERLFAQRAQNMFSIVQHGRFVNGITVPVDSIGAARRMAAHGDMHAQGNLGEPISPLKLMQPMLTWSSERGTARYVRCKH